jgi:branched-chain amino acid transport system substrate-binding protein
LSIDNASWWRGCGSGAQNVPVLSTGRAARAIVLALLTATATAGCTGSILSGNHSTAVVKIGVDLPLTGAEGRVATTALNGVRLFVQQHPVIDGFTVIVDSRDDAVGGIPEPVKGAANLQSLVGDPIVLAVIGPFDSSVARTEIPVANMAGLGLVSPATSSPCLTRSVYLPAGLSPTHTAVTCKDVGLPAAADLRPSGANNYFRLATTDDLQGPAAADYAYRTLRVLRVATISDHEAYGQALERGFTARFVKLGGSVVGHLDADPSAQPDVAGFLARMKADGAQAVYFGGVTANNGCTIRGQMAGVFPSGAPYLGGDGIAEDPACVRQAGAAASGIYATVPDVDPTSRGSAAGMISAFKTAYPAAADFSSYSVVAYDAAAIVYAAIDRAIKANGGKLPLRAEVVTQLAATQGFAGATGTIGFDAAGDTTHRVLSVYAAPGSRPGLPWTLVGEIDYSAALPY